jgi:hypothetical protein
VRLLLRATVVLLLLAVVAVVGLWLDYRPTREERGVIVGPTLPAAAVAARAARQTAATAALDMRGVPKQILFGDLHVHTTYSMDAFAWSLPLFQGEGAHPPADACDFARYCSALDFWALTDHAEALTPRHWRETKETIRQCNARAGDPDHPDLVSFLGFEWTQVGATPDTHWGHKNVIFRDTAEDAVPARPITSGGVATRAMRQSRSPFLRFIVPYAQFAARRQYQDLDYKVQELIGMAACPVGVDTRELPADCIEEAETPQALFEKLAQWDFPSLVIPHGTTWGLYTPPGARLDKQLAGAQHDPKRQRLIEVFSGHGNSEEYRDWRAVTYDADGNAECPVPSQGYLPCCHVAGAIIRGRCGDAPAEECEARVREAEQNFLAAGTSGRQTVPGATVEDWRDCGQCADCYTPAFSYRPGGSAQYALAIGNFDTPNAPRHFRFGFVASSDNHSARPGTGYKEFGRTSMSESRTATDDGRDYLVTHTPAGDGARSVRFDAAASTLTQFQVWDTERQASFFLTGGLVAVHAEGRDRGAIWEALERREVYGTSGDRILLWFDLINAGAMVRSMGSVVPLDRPPHFRVRAVGAFKQRPGCPPDTLAGLSAERIDALCHGECYHPGDERKRITRIEIVRIRPQVAADEPIAPLIEDPWRVFRCSDPAGCAVEFDDPEYRRGGRDVLYYVRAIEEPSPTVNGGNLRCDRDVNGACVAVHPCFGDERTARDDDCLIMTEERAWSSPIYLRHE